jgi:hypothetical protein
MSICDFLFSADLCVADPKAVLEQLKVAIGLPNPSPNAYAEYPDSGWTAIFALVNKSFTVAPTRLEIIGPKRFPGSPRPSQGESVYALQAPRSARTHATVLAAPRFDELAERLLRLGVRHWFQPKSEEVGFDRLWLGVTAEQPLDYLAETDDGFFVEIIPSDSPAFSPKLFTRPPPVPQDPAPGDMVRILSRAFLVADLDASLRKFERIFDWTPAGPVQDEPGLGYRTVAMSHNYAHGATLRLVQATDPDQPAGRDFARWGAGPHAIRIAVAGLDAKAAQMDAGGVAYARTPAGKGEPERLTPDTAMTGGTPFELVAWT